MFWLEDELGLFPNFFWLTPAKFKKTHANGTYDDSLWDFAVYNKKNMLAKRAMILSKPWRRVHIGGSDLQMNRKKNGVCKHPTSDLTISRH